MTKDVLISMKGLHSLSGAGDGQRGSEAAPDDAVEVFSAGKYYFRNGKHYVEYEERDDDSGAPIKNRITLRGHHLEVIRRGPYNTKMIFEENTKSTSWYETPIGSVLAGFDVAEMQVSESEDLIEIHVNYALEFNYEHVADSSIRIRIMAKDSGLFHLM
ncbi:MAG: DUF1934 domain-containing protein [Lachnospiraceae bacterium]|nr:DUF1934 domain-containing protein [Lachnospiraceae bacterium]